MDGWIGWVNGCYLITRRGQRAVMTANISWICVRSDRFAVNYYEKCQPREILWLKSGDGVRRPAAQLLMIIPSTFRHSLPHFSYWSLKYNYQKNYIIKLFFFLWKRITPPREKNPHSKWFDKNVNSEMALPPFGRCVTWNIIIFLNRLRTAQKWVW